MFHEYLLHFWHTLYLSKIGIFSGVSKLFKLFEMIKQFLECAYGELELFGKCACRQEFSVKSVGYSEVFVLTREDLWQIFEDFPEERDRLCARGIFPSRI